MLSQRSRSVCLGNGPVTEPGGALRHVNHSQYINRLNIVATIIESTEKRTETTKTEAHRDFDRFN